MAKVESNQAVDTLLEAIRHDEIKQVKILAKYVDDFGTLQSALMAAVKKRGVTTARVLLESNTCRDQGQLRKTYTSALRLACDNLDVALVELLLLHRADPHSREKSTFEMWDDREVSPIELTLEAYYRAVERDIPTADLMIVLNQLLDQKEVWTTGQSDGEFKGPPALLAAVAVGRPAKAEEILDSGVDVNAGVKFVNLVQGKKFALGEACRQRNAAFMNILLCRGADPYVEAGNRKFSYLEIYRKEPVIMVEALSRLDIEMIKMMFDFDDGMTRPNHIRSVAMLAAFTLGDITKQKLLAEMCISEDKDFIEKELSVAILSEHSKRVEMLLSYVKDINRNLRHTLAGRRASSTLCSPLELAIRSNKRTDVCDLVLEKGANVNLVSANTWLRGHSLLVVACICNHKMVPYLLRKGADPYLISAKGLTALHHVVGSGNDWEDTDKVGAIRALLDYGVDVNIRSSNGTTPLDEILKTVDDHTKFVGRRIIFRVPWSKIFMVHPKTGYQHNHVEFTKCVCLLLREGAEESARAARADSPLARETSSVVAGKPPVVLTIIRVIEFDKRTRLSWAKSGASESHRKQHKPNILELVKVAVGTGSLTWREVVRVNGYIKDIDDEEYEDIEEYLEGFLTSGYTLKELCRLRLRDLIRPPLKVNVMSDGLEYPHQLKKYLLFQDF